MEILNYLLASKRAQPQTLSHTDLLILSVFLGSITMCKSRSPAALNACIVTSPPLTPSALLRGPHTPVKLRLPEHQSIHSPEPPGVYWKHTHKHGNGRDWGSTSTSGADWRERQWKHDQPIHFCSWGFFFSPWHSFSPHLYYSVSPAHQSLFDKRF